jgi:hypothetical protein
MKHLLTLIVLTLFLSSCQKSDIDPKQIEGKWTLKSLNFILDGKTYTASKKALDATNWINVEWEFISGGTHYMYFNGSKVYGKYKFDGPTSKLTTIDKYSFAMDYSAKLNNQVLELYSIEVKDASLNYQINSQEGEVLMDAMWFLSDVMSNKQVRASKTVQTQYVFEKK